MHFKKSIQQTLSVLFLVTTIFLFFAGCDGDSNDGTGSTDGDTDGDSDGDADCKDLPDTPVEVNTLKKTYGWHGLAFDKDGYIYGQNDSSLVKVKDGQMTVVAKLPGEGIEGLTFLPDGDIIAATSIMSSTGAILRITPAGAISTIATIIDAYDVILGPDNNIYISSCDKVSRLNPSTGKVTMLVDGGTPYSEDGGFVYKSIDFSPDHTKLYIGASGSEGIVYVQDLDKDLNPVGKLEVLADGLGASGGANLDGLAVDKCGNLFVTEMWGDCIYRISPDGDVKVFYKYKGDGSIGYGHNVVFGSGKGEWKKDAIYLPLPYNEFGSEVLEVVVGVTSR